MKKTVMFTALYIMLCACTTNANTSAQEEDTVAAAAQDSTLKITTIKHIYQEADANGNGFLENHYASKEFAAVLSLQADYSLNYDFDNLGPDDCSEMAPALVEGNGYALEDEHTAKFYLNDLNQVVAELKFEDDSGEHNYSRVTFELNCQNNQCLVTDMISSYGDSLKADIKQYCPH